MRYYHPVLYIFGLVLFALLIGLPVLVFADKQAPSALLFESGVNEYGQIQADAAIWLTGPSPDFSQYGAPRLVAPDADGHSDLPEVTAYSPCSQPTAVMTVPPLGVPGHTAIEAKAFPLWLRLTDWPFDDRTYQNYNILIWSPLRGVEQYQLVPDWQLEDEPKNLALSDPSCCKLLSTSVQSLPGHTAVNF